MRIRLMERVLQRLNASSPHIEASALISSDGLLICSALPDDIEEDRVSAMAAALTSLSERVCAELNKGQFEQIVMQGNEGFFMCQSVGDDALLTVMINQSGKFGTFFNSVKEVKNALNILLEQVYDDYQ